MPSKITLLVTGAVLTATVAGAPAKSISLRADTLVPKAADVAIVAGDGPIPLVGTTSPSSTSSSDANLPALTIEKPANVPPTKTSSSSKVKRTLMCHPIWDTSRDDEPCCSVM